MMTESASQNPITLSSSSFSSDQQPPYSMSGPSNVHIPHAVQEINGKKITVVWVNDRRWMIGVQVAALLERETYNLYRSLKVKNIEVKRATVEQIDYLLKNDIVRTGTRSITFISLDHSISFLSDELRKLEKKKHKNSNVIPPSKSSSSPIQTKRISPKQSTQQFATSMQSRSIEMHNQMSSQPHYHLYQQQQQLQQQLQQQQSSQYGMVQPPSSLPTRLTLPLPVSTSMISSSLIAPLSTSTISSSTNPSVVSSSNLSPVPVVLSSHSQSPTHQTTTSFIKLENPNLANSAANNSASVSLVHPTNTQAGGVNSFSLAHSNNPLMGLSSATLGSSNVVSNVDNGLISRSVPVYPNHFAQAFNLARNPYTQAPSTDYYSSTNTTLQPNLVSNSTPNGPHIKLEGSLQSNPYSSTGYSNKRYDESNPTNYYGTYNFVPTTNSFHPKTTNSASGFEPSSPVAATSQLFSQYNNADEEWY